jgi:iron complex outermembrane receptor protein
MEEIQVSRIQNRPVLAVRSVSAAVRLALGCGMFAVAATPVLAAEDEELAEVVVTAQFREQSVQDTPLAITAVSAEMLEARSQTNITEVANQAPSVTLRQAAPQYGPSIQAYVRGIGQLDFNPALEPGVGMYVDDVYFATLTGSVLDLLDLDRVEVLRGPQGTLAGKNSIGGAVKLYSQKPTAEAGGYFSATYGTRDRVDLRGSANFALTDKLFVRLSGVDKVQDGYVDRLDYGCVNPAGGIPALRTTIAGCRVARDSNVNFSAVRGALRWIVLDDLEFNLAADYTDDDRNPTGAVLVDANTVANSNIQPVQGATNLPLSAFVVPRGSYYSYASYNNSARNYVGALPILPGQSYQNQYQGLTLGVSAGVNPYPLLESRPRARQYFKGGGTSLTTDWKLFDGLALKSVTAWRWYDSGFANDNDQSPLNSSIGDGTLPFHSFSEELRVNGALLDDRINWTAGGFYMKQASRYESWQDLRYTGQANSYSGAADARRFPLQFQQNDRVGAETKAAFAHASWQIIDLLTINAGLRYTDESKDYTFVRKNRNGTTQSFLGVLDGVVSEYSGNNLDYRVNVQFDWTENLMTYVQYATGFKGGGISPRPFVPTQAVAFDPETLDTIEAGVKSDLFDRRLRINGSVYWGKYKDIQLSLQACPQLNIPVGSPGPCGAIANAGTGEVKGLEIETVLRLLPQFTVDASYSYFDFKYTFVDPQVQGSGLPWNITMDDTLPFSPKSKFAVGAQYDWILPNGSRIVPRADLSYQSSLYTNAANQRSNFIDSYSLLNARLTWRSTDGMLDVSLEGTNLTDKYYFTSRADQLQAAGHTDGAPGRPREWAVTIKKRF